MPGRLGRPSIASIYDDGALEKEPKRLLGFKLLGAIAAGPDSNWSFKLTGPEDTVEANQQACEEVLVGSLQGEPIG